MGSINIEHTALIILPLVSRLGQIVPSLRLCRYLTFIPTFILMMTSALSCKANNIRDIRDIIYQADLHLHTNTSLLVSF